MIDESVVDLDLDATHHTRPLDIYLLLIKS